MKIASLPVATQNVKPNYVAAGNEPEDNKPAGEPQDKVSTSSDEPKTGSEFGNIVKFGLGGAGALAMVIPAAYAGVLGGAVVGSLFGAGIGPAVSSVTTDGALNFLGGIWNSTSGFAKAGMVIGAASGLVGGWKVGTGAGQAVGRIFGADIEKSKPEDLQRLRGVAGLYATVVSGAGTAAGFVGGGLIGAGIGAGTGILASGFSLENLGTNALIGAAVGGVGMGLIGGTGGVTIAKGSAKAGTWVVDTASNLFKKVGDSEPLDEKAQRLEELEQNLKGRSGSATTDANTSRAHHQDQTAQLDTRERDLIGRENDANRREGSIDGDIAAEGKADYDKRYESETVDNGQTLKEWNATLSNFKAELDEFQKTHEARERAIDAEIEQRGQAGYAELRPALEKEYADLQAQLDNFEGRLNQQESRIEREIEDRFQDQFQPQKRDYEGRISRARSDESRARNEKSSAQQDYNLAAGELRSAKSERDSAVNAANSAEGRVNSLRREISQLGNRITNLQRQISQMESTISSLESQLRNCK